MPPSETSENNGIPLSYIKNIAIQLHDSYRLDNTPFPSTHEENESEEQENIKTTYLQNIWRKLLCLPKKKTKLLLPHTADVAPERSFIGREQLCRKFLEFLRGFSKKGVFLVTGYRGMGKTSFVNYVLNTYKKERKKLISIHLTITQNKPKEIDLLKLMVATIYEKYIDYLNFHEKNEEQQLKDQRRCVFKRMIQIGIVFVCLFFIIINRDTVKTLLTNQRGFNGRLTDGISFLKLIAYIIVPILFVRFLWLLGLWAKTKQKESHLKEDVDNPLTRIKSLYERCQASITEEASDSVDSEVQGGLRIFLGSQKRAKQYPIADSKEMEFELQQFLSLSHTKDKIEYIFIFDELDKVDTAISTSYMYDDIENFERKIPEDQYQRELRDRKQAIINIISGLKNFFTNTQARFIFIAGREMFDASLADIADRQSSISSIFTYTFNVESLLKERELQGNNNNASLSNAVEEYLKRLFFDSDIIKNDKRPFLKLVNDLCDKYKLENNEKYKVHFILQNFITYLVYRSNGSPKKLIKAIHEFISVRNTIKTDKTIIVSHFRNTTPDSKDPDKLFLYFNYFNQYRIGFISYLYRPFLIQYGRSLKLYSDNIILSTPYLFDHLIKFHPFAFSLTNIELIPEVLSTNKTPYLREYIKQIITFLRNTHLRDTDIALFDLKFYSRTQNEIKFISKIFEQEAAAFNFTLDESYLVKLHVRSKIKELRSIYAKFLGDNETAKQQIFSIAHVNGTLGDLHFFDQEYDDAIVAYSDAIRPINHLKVSSMNLRDFISLIKNKLKLGLCFERINSYGEALAFYSDSAMDAKRFMFMKIDTAINVFDKEEMKEVKIKRRQHQSGGKINDEEEFDLYHSSSMNDVLQIIIQSFLAKIIVQEKMGIEGVSFPKLNIALGSFLLIAEKIEKFSSNNHLIVSNAYLLIGKLLFFKNSQAFAELREPKATMPSPDFAEDILKLHDRYGKYLNFSKQERSEHCSGRKPILALYFYIFGICEVVSSRKVKENLLAEIEGTAHGDNIAYPILEYLHTYLYSNDERLTGFHYRYIGTFLSNIGDCLLSMCYPIVDESKEDPLIEENIESYNQVDIENLLHCDFEKFDEFQSENDRIDPDKEINYYNFLRYLKKPSSKTFGLRDVMFCYYLSGQYFLKFGRSVSCSLQYRKILHVLRLVLCSSNNPVKKKASLWIIQHTLVKPILEIISQGAGGSDQHMHQKALDHGISSEFSLNNISNHPDIREVLFLYNYIRIKIGDRPDKIDHLVNSSYSFATQYSRIMELDFYAKYIYKDPTTLLFALVLSPEILIDHFEITINCLYSMLAILRKLSIYGKDYLLGYSYIAYTHYRIALFLSVVSAQPAYDDADIKKALDNLLGHGSFVSTDILYHYEMAKDFYAKTVELHTAGNEYKKALNTMTYLEDDFNDNAYHFGAAVDRYMMINGVFSAKIKECSEKIRYLSSLKNRELFKI